MRSSAGALALASALAVSSTNVVGAQELANFPNLQGTWQGSYAIAFPKTHALFPDEMKEVQHEFDFYKQEANLLWVEHRWRRSGSDDWNTEYGTGSFDVHNPTSLVITEIGPLPSEGAQTGVFYGRIEDDRLFLTYSGVGGGVSFSSGFERKSN